MSLLKKIKQQTSRMQSDIGWTEVRRKRRPNNNHKKEVETTYFVTNVPRTATKREVWKTYAGFGRLSDVYMANNRGKNGEYFAFIRFLGVEHARMLERQLDGQTLRVRTLAVNLSLHERKEPPGCNNKNNSNDGKGH